MEDDQVGYPLWLCQPFYFLLHTIMTTEKKKYRIGGILAGKTLIIENGFLRYTSAYARTFRVPLADIRTIAVDDAGWGRAWLKIMGNGMELAKIKLPYTWANKAQDWILKNK